MKSFLEKAGRFFRLDMWATGFKGRHQKDPWYAKIFKVLFMSLQGFKVDRCGLNASALTYYSLLAIVPLLALAFGIAKGFHLDQIIEKELMAQFEQYQTVIKEAIGFAKQLLHQTKGGLIAAIGILVLLWAIFKVLNHIEGVFNRIWLARKGRTWKRKFTDYLVVGIISPTLVIISNATAVLMITEAQEFTKELPVIGSYADWILLLLNIVPYLATTVLLTFLYMFIPSVTVRFRTGILAALVTAGIYHFTQYFYVYFQIGIARYGAIYGSFAAFPLFLIWIQISWMIVLFGAELSYSIQNLGIFGLKQIKRKVSVSDRRILMLGIMHLLVKNFQDRKPPMAYREISRQLEIPYQVSSQLIDNLVDCHLAVIAQDGKKGYQPAIDTSDLRVMDVVTAIEKQEEETLKIAKNEELQKIETVLDRFEFLAKESSQNCLLKDL